MNAMTEHRSGALAVPEKNYFEQYSEAAAGTRIVGDLLRFNKGDWRAGQDGTKLPIGTRLVAAIPDLRIGWVKWQDEKPVEQLMGLIAEGYKPQRRSELGDTDESLWETDDEGRPRDPWQLTNTLILKEEDGEQLYTLAGSSKGLLNAIGQIAGAYGKRYRQKPGEIPVISLEADEYKHKVYSWVKVPVLKVVGWVNSVEIDGVLAADAAENGTGNDEGNADEPPFDADPELAKGGGKGGGKTKSAAASTQF